MTDLSHARIPLDQFPAAFTPFHCAPVVGIVCSHHADFITIVDGRRSRVRHLDKRYQILTFFRQVRGCLICRKCTGRISLCPVVINSIQEGKHSCRIVRANQIHHCIESFFRITLSQFFQFIYTVLSASAFCVCKHSVAEHIVHNGVIHISQQILGRVIPDFSDDHVIAVKRFYRLPELLPGLIGYLVCNVKSPAVRALCKPVLRHASLSVDDLFRPSRSLILRSVRGNDNRHGVVAPPAVVSVYVLPRTVADGILHDFSHIICQITAGKVKPLGICKISNTFSLKIFPCLGLGLVLRRLFMFRHIIKYIRPVRISAHFSVLPYKFVVAVKIYRVIRHMVEHAVQDHVHIICLCDLNQFRKVSQIAEDRIDLRIIRSVVSMARDRVEYRI